MYIKKSNILFVFHMKTKTPNALEGVVAGIGGNTGGPGDGERDGSGVGSEDAPPPRCIAGVSGVGVGGRRGGEGDANSAEEATDADGERSGERTEGGALSCKTSSIKIVAKAGFERACLGTITRRFRPIGHLTCSVQTVFVPHTC